MRRLGGETFSNRQLTCEEGKSIQRQIIICKKFTVDAIVTKQEME